MKLAYATLFDATDVRNWSGLDLHIWKALASQGVDVELIGNLRHGRSLRRRLRKTWGTKVERKAFLHLWDVDTARGYASDVANQLARSTADIVLSPTPIPLAFLECRQPRVLWTDATFAGLASFYPEFSPHRLCRATTRSGHAIDQKSLQNCDLAIYSSDWAARTALAINGTAKICTVPFGANLDTAYSSVDISRLVARRNEQPLTLLFIGMDWARKGGDHAVAVATELVQRGRNLEMVLIGAQPPAQILQMPFVRYIGVVDKTTAAGHAVIARHLQDSHFLILPSRAECCAVVLAEACAHGLPVLCTDVGGQQTIIDDGQNGRLFKLDQSPPAWADWIDRVSTEEGAYARLSHTAFETFTTRCNWRVAGATVTSLLNDILFRRTGVAA